MRIILASESPFRKRALDLLGLPYETFPAAIDEKAIRHDDPVVLTQILAEAKARKVASQCPEAIIVAGDAVAALHRKIYEKPQKPRGSGRLSSRTLGRRIPIHNVSCRAELCHEQNAVRRGNVEHQVPSTN